MAELFTLLEENYIESENNDFRLCYSQEFLKWALTMPDWQTDWLCAVRDSDTKKMVGFAAASPVKLGINGNIIDMVSANFLCVSKTLR